MEIGHIQKNNTMLNGFLDLKNIGLDTLFAFIALLVRIMCKFCYTVAVMAAILNYGKIGALAVSGSG